MKKIFLATILSLFAVAAMAQVRPTFIISGGYQGANLSLNDKSDSNKMRSGFRAGVAADIVVYDLGTGELSIQPGLNYSVKGSKEINSLINRTYTVNLGYIDLPILANLRFGVTPEMNVFVNAGPYIAYGINSNSAYKTSTGNKNLDNIVDGISNAFDLYKDAFKKDGWLNPFDAGLQVGAGAEYKRIMLSVGGQLGLMNMTKKTDNKTINKYIDTNFKRTNTSFFVTVGYRF